MTKTNLTRSYSFGGWKHVLFYLVVLIFSGILNEANAQTSRPLPALKNNAKSIAIAKAAIEQYVIEIQSVGKNPGNPTFDRPYKLMNAYNSLIAQLETPGVTTADAVWNVYHLFNDNNAIDYTSTSNGNNGSGSWSKDFSELVDRLKI